MTAPALVIAIPLLIGVLIGASTETARVLMNAGLGCAWVFAAIAIARRRTASFVIFSVTGFLWAGVSLGSPAQPAAAPPPLLDWYARSAAADAPAHLTGVLRADASPGASGVSLVLDVDAVNDRPAEGGVRLSVSGSLATRSAAAWRAGRAIAVDASLREPLDYLDPGVPSDRARLARQGLALVGSVKSGALVAVVARGSIFSEAAATLRARVRTATASAVGQW